MGSLHLVGVNHDDFRVFDPNDLDARNVRDRRAIARLDAHTTDLDGAGCGHKVGVPLGIEIDRRHARQP